MLARLKAKGHGQVLNRSELLSGPTDVEYFHPVKFRLEPDLLAAVLGGLVYSLTPRITDHELVWYKRPAALGVAVLALTLVLNIIFW